MLKNCMQNVVPVVMTRITVLFVVTLLVELHIYAWE